MDHFDVRPTVDEYFLLRRLYRANREGMHLSCDSKPAHTRRLADRELIIVKPPEALFSQGHWCVYLCADGEDYYLYWRHKLVTWVIGIAVTLIVAAIGIA